MAIIEIKYKISQIRLALGAIVIGISAGVFDYGPIFGLKWLAIPSGAFLFVIGVLLFLTGCFEIVPSIKLISRWDDEMIRRTIKSAPSKSTIRILQTWIPDKEIFCPDFEEMLIDGDKQFRLKILLMNVCETGTEINDLLDARVRLRKEDRDYAKQQINTTVSLLMQTKQHIDKAWENKYSGAKFDLEIRSYKFMPFGPIYQIGKSHIFIGFYLNFESSVHGPMLVIRNPKSRIWKIFEENFTRGWEDSEKINEI